MTKPSLEAMKKKAIALVPKLAKKLAAGCRAMEIEWCGKVPSEGDIVQALTCIINDLDNETCVEAETGRLFAKIEERDGVWVIEFGLKMFEYVLKAK